MLMTNKIILKHIFSYVMCLTLYKSAFGLQQKKIKQTHQIGSKGNLLSFGFDERKLAKRLSFNDVEYSADKSFYYLKPSKKLFSLNSDYKLYDDDPVPFYSRKNRPNYHRYRIHMSHKKSRLSKTRNKNRRSYNVYNGERKGYYNQRGIYLDINPPSVAFGPPIFKQGTTRHSFPRSERISNSRKEKRFGHPLRGNLVPIIGVGVAFGQVLRQFLG